MFDFVSSGIGLSSNEEIIDLSGWTSNNVYVNGLTKNLDSETVP